MTLTLLTLASDPPAPAPTSPGDAGVGAAISHGDVPVAVPLITSSCADWPGASVVVVGAAAFGGLVAGELVFDELEQPGDERHRGKTGNCSGGIDSGPLHRNPLEA